MGYEKVAYSNERHTAAAARARAQSKAAALCRSRLVVGQVLPDKQRERDTIVGDCDGVNGSRPNKQLFRFCQQRSVPKQLGRGCSEA